MSKRLEDRNGLVSDMANCCGADVAESFRQGVIGPRQYRDFLKRCSECEATEACQRLLEAVEKLEKPPEYCRNREEIAELRDRLARALS